MKFSEKLMSLRKSKGMSQEELADKLDVTRQTVSKWELEQTVPDMNKLIEISKLFKISLDELTNDNEITNNEKTNNNEISSSKNEYKECSIEKKNKKIAISIFIVGLIIGFVFTGIGVIRHNNAKKTNEEIRSQAQEQTKLAVDNANARLKEIEQEISRLKEQSETKQYEADSMSKTEPNWYANYTKLMREATNISNQIRDLNIEKFEIEDEDYSVEYQLVNPLSYSIFYCIGVGGFTFLSLVALTYYLVTRKNR